LNRREITVKNDGRVPRAVLPNHRLMFNHRTGYGNLEEEEKAEVHGVVYELSEEDWRKVQEAELGYRVKRVRLETYDKGEQPVEALTFVSEEDVKILSKDPSSLRPLTRYAELLREGARYHELDSDWQVWLAELETNESIPKEYYETSRSRKTKAIFASIFLILSLAATVS
jgi:gamma-glutamylcyclotransferase (GGCT)/AIG2-like uncharacterized protein YtfP